MKMGFAEAVMPGKASPSAPPVMVNAPVIMDLQAPEGTDQLKDFVASLGYHDVQTVASEESRRLKPYFSAIKRYLKPVVQKLDDRGKKAKMKQLVTQGGLSDLFTKMAELMRTTLLSDVMIVPADRSQFLNRTSGDAAILQYRLLPYMVNGSKPEQEDFTAPPEAGEQELFSFSFGQVFEGNKKANATYSTFMPILSLSEKMMQRIAPFHAEQMLHDLQATMTIVNHDMWHHFTQPGFAFPRTRTPHKIDYSFMSAAYEDILRDEHLAGVNMLEAAAQLQQEKIILQPGNQPLVDMAMKKAAHFFDELERISKLIPDQGQREEAVNYFGIVMIHGLTRAFPLDHPAITGSLQRLQEIDPLPEEALKKFSHMVTNSEPPAPAPTRQHMLAMIRGRIESDPLIKDIVTSFREQGFEVFPDDDEKVGYAHIKMFQLIAIGGLHSHTPPLKNEALATLRRNTAEITVNLLDAAAQTVGYPPPAAKK